MGRSVPRRARRFERSGRRPDLGRPGRTTGVARTGQVRGRTGRGLRGTAHRIRRRVGGCPGHLHGHPARRGQRRAARRRCVGRRAHPGSGGGEVPLAGIGRPPRGDGRVVAARWGSGPVRDRRLRPMVRRRGAPHRRPGPALGHPRRRIGTGRRRRIRSGWSRGRKYLRPRSPGVLEHPRGGRWCRRSAHRRRGGRRSCPGWETAGPNRARSTSTT